VIVDTHCHACLDWYEPVETLLSEMDRNGVERAVLTQILGQYDNSYQRQCVDRHPSRFASVVLVDTERPDAPEELARLARDGAAGVRLRATTRSPGDDPLAIWRAADRLGLPVSCPGSSADFAADEFAQLIGELPQLPIVLEHLASASRPDASPEEAALRRKAFSLARFPNVYIKVPGLGEFAQRVLPVRSPFPFAEPIPNYLEEAYDAFGAGRMMWGSDFPPVAAREGYARALNLCREQFGAKPAADQEAIFGGTAARLFFPS